MIAWILRSSRMGRAGVPKRTLPAATLLGIPDCAPDCTPSPRVI